MASVRNSNCYHIVATFSCGFLCNRDDCVYFAAFANISNVFDMCCFLQVGIHRSTFSRPRLRLNFRLAACYLCNARW